MASAPAITHFSLAQAGTLIRQRELSPVELTEAFLDRISVIDRQVKAYVTLLPERSLAEARRAEAEVMADQIRGPLHGIPIALKDLIATAGVPTQAGSRLLEGLVPTRSATVADRLEQAGTVLLGKATTHEFAMDVQTPPTRNPWDLQRIPGGSSGGSAAAVAARLCFGAIGTDTGGSIRIPAALCGVSGLKPTYGLVSRAGVIPFSWSLDHVGPIAQSAEDVALLLQAIAGFDASDPASAREPVRDYVRASNGNIQGTRIGVPADFFFDRVEETAASAVEDAVDVLSSLGASTRPLSLPNVQLAPIVGDVISFPEASLYHRRWVRNSPELYTSRTRANLVLGEFVSAADYVHAHRVRHLITRELRSAFEHVDAIVAPTTPVAAVLAEETSVSIGGDKPESTLDAYCRLTYPGNVTGFPALSIPCGFTAEGLPLGLQLIGRPFDEGLLLRIGVSYQHATDWHSRDPKGAPWQI